MILEKYYNRDIVNTFTSITLFIISIVSANLLIRLFHEAYSRGLGIDSIIKFVILTLPENVSIIVPIGMFLSIILCFGKYFSNNEMFVTLAGGITWMEIVKKTLKPAIFLTIITLITTMYLIPLSKQTLDIYQSSLSAKSLLSSLTDDKIIKIPDGKVLYIKDKVGNNLHNIFLYQKSGKDNKYKVITSLNAQIDSNKKAAYIYFKDVIIYTINPQNSKISYGKADNAIYIIYDNTIRDFNHRRVDRYYMHYLIKNFNNKDPKFAIACKGEFFSRINNSLAVLVGSLIALSLCRLRPRQNKYAKLLPSVLVLAIYLCTNMFINTCMIHGSVSFLIGSWFPHIIFIISSIMTIRKQNGSSRKI